MLRLFTPSLLNVYGLHFCECNPIHFLKVLLKAFLVILHTSTTLQQHFSQHGTLFAQMFSKNSSNGTTGIDNEKYYLYAWQRHATFM